MTEKNLEQEIKELSQHMKLQNSLRRNFVISIVRGFGSALGATVVFGLVIAFLFQIVRSIDYVPILNGILNSQAIEEVIKRFTQSPI